MESSTSQSHKVGETCYSVYASKWLNFNWFNSDGRLALRVILTRLESKCRMIHVNKSLFFTFLHGYLTNWVWERDKLTTRAAGQCDHRIRKWNGNDLIVQNKKKVHKRAKKIKNVRAGLTMKIITVPPVPQWVELTDIVVDATSFLASTTINFWLISMYPESSSATTVFSFVSETERI